MGLLNLFRRGKDTGGDTFTETRTSGGFTSQIIAARESFISGRAGLAELTATVQGAVSLWEGALAAADVDGTDLLTRRHMALAARSLALRGEAVFYVEGDRLVPASDWDIVTRFSLPRAYRLTLPEVGGGRTVTALAAEVLHFTCGADVTQPWHGVAPLRRSNLSADFLEQVETALRDVYRDAPMGSMIVPLPDSQSTDMERMRHSFRGRRGSALVVEGVAQATAAGMNPQLGKSPDDLTPDLQRAMPRDMLEAARASVLMAFGVLPALSDRSGQGPMVREAQRHLATWTLSPIAMMMAEEVTDKLGTECRIDVLRPLQAFDAGGRARAFGAMVEAMARAKEAGLLPGEVQDMAKLVDWENSV